MNWPARLLICGIMTIPGLLVSKSRLSTHSTGHVATVQHRLSQVGAESSAKRAEPASGAPSTASACYEIQPLQAGTVPGAPPDSYKIIVERNIFALQPAPPPKPIPSAPELPPAKDLFLTGLCDLNSVRTALFKMVEAGQPPICFTLTEGEQNDWLEVLSVAPVDRTVIVRLKKPVMRIRSIGVKVTLSLQTRG